MGKSDFLRVGSWNRVCDRTGFKIKAEGTRKEWTNSIVRKESWEPRQPQDLLRSRPDHQQIPDPRSEQDDRFLDPNEVLEDITGEAIPTFLGFSDATPVELRGRLISSEGPDATSTSDDVFLLVER